MGPFVYDFFLFITLKSQNRRQSYYKKMICANKSADFFAHMKNILYLCALNDN